MKNNLILLKGGYVVSMDKHIGNFPQADVLIREDRIIEVAPNIHATDAQVIDASGMILAPGLIDTHRHLWETSIRGIAGNWSLMEYLQKVLGPLAALYRPEDVYLSNLLGSLEALNAGITTVFDWSHIMNTPDHADAAIGGLKEAGIRAKFAYGTPGTSVWEWFYESKLTHPQDVRRVRETHFSSEEGLVTMAMAIRGPEYSTLQVSKHDMALAREQNLQISMHIGCGTFGPKYNGVHALYQAGLLGPDVNFAHCNSLSESDFGLLSDHGCSVSITPEVEMQMGIGFPATGKAIRSGIRPGLGVDVVTGVAGDLFSQMKIALQTERAISNEKALQGGQMPENITLMAKDVLQMATIDGAKTLGLEHKTGSITPGKQADIILVNRKAIDLSPVLDPISALTLFANPSHVDSVFVAGKLVKQKGKLLRSDLSSLLEKAQASTNYLLERAGVSQELFV